MSVQLHEFESLVLVDPGLLQGLYPEHASGVDRLVAMAAAFASPEQIDGGQETAPSKRIAKEIPTYSKTVAGPIVTTQIGLPNLRAKCPHFGAWIDRLEGIAPSVNHPLG